MASASNARSSGDGVKLSTKGRYAVMAMVDLARSSGGNPVTLCEISQRQEISLSYLEQLFAKLRRSELVCSVRGPGGGYRLARDCSELFIADIILAVDEQIRATRCCPGTQGGCHEDGSTCLTHDLWEALGEHTYQFLSAVSLRDVVERRLCPLTKSMAFPALAKRQTDTSPDMPTDTSTGTPLLAATVKTAAAE